MFVFGADSWGLLIKEVQVTHTGLKLLSTAQMMLSLLENWDLAKARIWLIVLEFFQHQLFIKN